MPKSQKHLRSLFPQIAGLCQDYQEAIFMATCCSFVYPPCLVCLLQYCSEDDLWIGLAVWELVHIFLGTQWGN